MPRLLSESDRSAFCARLARYARQQGVNRCAVIFHGGEPLLAGVDAIVQFAVDLRRAVGTDIELDIGMQTNGLLLSEEALDKLAKAEISVSLSLDGPREANDRHRTTRKRRSSFDRVLVALEALKRRPNIFAGVIAVIDPAVPPEALFEFFSSHSVPKLDFLLPDAHHQRPPPGRELNPDLYKAWLIRAFDLWLDCYPSLRVRTFEAVLDAIVGLDSGTDAFGLGDVSLITIETDGTYHDLDVLKVVGDGATKLSGSVRDTDIHEVANSPPILFHRKHLRKSGLCATCQTCPVVDACGGGSLPHRFGPDGFNHPSVYCSELLALFTHAKRCLSSQIQPQKHPFAAAPPPFDLGLFERAERSCAIVSALWDDAERAHCVELLEAVGALANGGRVSAERCENVLSLPPDKLARLANRPGTIAWQSVLRKQATGRAVHTIDGKVLRADELYLDFASSTLSSEQVLEIGAADEWLQEPFGDAILFEGEAVAELARPLVRQALRLVDEWRPSVGFELRRICRSIQFVRDPSAHPEKIVSFSDNTVPGALYVSVTQGRSFIDPYDLADSLIHEYRHQKLYLFERRNPTVTSAEMRVTSPWREDLRPPSGLLHAVFVFVELRRFWEFVHAHGPARLQNRAVNQIADTERNLALAFNTLEACPLSESGRALANVLRSASDEGAAMDVAC